MRNSLALAIAPIVLFAAAALANPSDVPTAASVIQSNGVQTAQSTVAPVGRPDGAAPVVPRFSNHSELPSATVTGVPAAPIPLKDSTLSLVNGTGGGG